MTLIAMLEVAGFALVAAQTGWIVMLHRRLGELRGSLSTAPDVAAALDAAARRLDDASGTTLASVKEKIAELDRKSAAFTTKAAEFDAVTKKAQAAADRLERALRSGKGRIPPPLAPAPREGVEPLGFSEHMAARGAAPIPESEALPHELIQRILSAQMPLGTPAGSPADAPSPVGGPAR